jgi:uncharacterized protein (TIGR02147 family)
MPSIFEFDNYRKFLEACLNKMPHKGYGQMTRMAEALAVHPSLISQVLKEHKGLTTDQAAGLADFLGLGELEAEYFVLLVQLERAGQETARALYRKQIRRVLDQAQSLSRRVTAESKLSESQRATFYSDWAYSAIRQASAIAGVDTVEKIQRYLGLPRRRVQALMEFLVNAGLCKISGTGRVKVGPASTHLESTSPWVRAHHTNWRQRAIHAQDGARAGNLHYTAPLTLSKRDAIVIREKLIQWIKEVNAIVDPSPSEALYCLNLDWFQEGENDAN